MSEYTAVEKKVADLNALRRRAQDIEDAMRSFRLGAKVETVDDRPLLRRIQWRAMVYGGGWLTQDAEPFPGAVEQDFYQFLRKRESKIWDEIRELEKELAALA